MMNYSIFWARLIGLYAVLLAIGVLLDVQSYQALIKDMDQNHSLTITMGIFTLLLGVAMLVTHQVFKGWPILVTLLGYWITIKGMLLLAFPSIVHHVILFWENKNWYLAPLPSLLIGLILLYFGFCASRKTMTQTPT